MEQKCQISKLKHQTTLCFLTIFLEKTLCKSCTFFNQTRHSPTELKHYFHQTEQRNATFSPILRTVGEKRGKKRVGGSRTRLENKLKRETFFYAYLGERRKV